jgi:hypothetical protein
VVIALNGAKTVGVSVIDAVGETVGVGVSVGVGGVGVGMSVSVGGMAVSVGASVSAGGRGVGVAAGAIWQAERQIINAMIGTADKFLTTFSFAG